MRILSGEAKGRTLKTREGKGTRPTDSRSREMLFNILSTRIEGARFLDLYAGNGGVGLEALSRGAAHCVFVEQNAVAAAIIRENLKTCGWQERAQVWHASVKSALHRFAEMHAAGVNDDLTRFDIVFADPPFTAPRELDDLAARLDNAPWLLHNGTGQNGPAPVLLVVQHHRKAVFRTEKISVFDARRAGESTLSFCRPSAQIQSETNPEGGLP